MKLSPGKAAAITSLLLLLLFPNILVLLAYTVNESILLGILAAISGGLIVGWSLMEPEQQQLEIERDKTQEDEEVQNVDSASSIPKKISENKKDLRAENNREEENEEQNSTVYPGKLIEGLLPNEPNEDIKTMLKKHKMNLKKATNRGKKSTHAKRKSVSLLSWFLMKEGRTSKTRRR